MLMERVDISRLRKNSTIHFKIGLILSLCLVIWAFTIEQKTPQLEPVDLSDAKVLEEIEVIRTPNTEKRQPPPPAITPETNEIEIDEFEFETEPIIDPIDLDEIPVEPTDDWEDTNFSTAPPLPEPLPMPEDPREEMDEPFILVEQMPLFGDCPTLQASKQDKQWCSDKAVLQYMADKLNYPPIARENNIQGTVVIQFIIDKKGRITKATIVKDIGGGCGREALRVVQSMPNWAPGKQQAQPVLVKMNLPVRFRLQ